MNLKSIFIFLLAIGLLRSYPRAQDIQNYQLVKTLDGEWIQFETELALFKIPKISTIEYFETLKNDKDSVISAIGKRTIEFLIDTDSTQFYDPIIKGYRFAMSMANRPLTSYEYFNALCGGLICELVDYASPSVLVEVNGENMERITIARQEDGMSILTRGDFICKCENTYNKR